MKKTLSFILALAMLLSCVVIPTALAEDDWITLKVECYDRSVTGFNVQDCMQLHYIQENFGDPNHIKVEFVPTSRWEETNLLTTWMGGKSAPDLCMTYGGNLIDQWVQDEALYPLDDLLAEYGQNLIAFLGEDLLDYGKYEVDGEKIQYTIPARRISVANVGHFIRGDWLEKLNMEEPTTIAELEAYLIAAKEANLGGEVTYPFLFGLYKPDPLINVKRFTDPFIEFSKVTEEDWVAYYGNHEMLPGSKEGYRWLNKLYNLGLMPEGFEVDDGTLGDKYRVLGNTGFFTEQPDQPWRTDKNLAIELGKNVPGAYWTSVNCFANIEDGRTLHDVYAANGLSVLIPWWVSEETAIAAMKYLDWMAMPENMFFLQNGVEGINYLSVNEDGIPVEAQGTDLVDDAHKMHAGDVCFIANGLWYGDMEKSNAAIALGFPGFEKEVEAAYADAYTDTWTEISVTVPLQSVIDYESTVKVKQGEFLIQVVTCKPEDFDATYDEYIQLINDSGAAQIIEERRQAYKDGNWRGSYPYAEAK